MIARESVDRVTIRATRVANRIVLDGRLEEEVYARVSAISGLVQQEPHEGQPATEKTEVWLLFDDQNIYVSARCWDSHPEREVTKEMRRDNSALFDNDMCGRQVYAAIQVVTIFPIVDGDSMDRNLPTL